MMKNTFTNDSIVTDGDIQALVDNELSWEEGKKVLSYIESNSTAQKRYDEIMRQKKLLKLWHVNTAH